jgi:hypothetical protein
MVADMPMSDHQWQMHAIPEVGSHYWHDRTGYRLDRIEHVEGETRVHLVGDRDWEEAVSAGLPDEYMVMGGRDSHTGEWHFRVVGAKGPVIGWAFGEDLESTIARAVATALEALGDVGQG